MIYANYLNSPVQIKTLEAVQTIQYLESFSSNHFMYALKNEETNYKSKLDYITFVSDKNNKKNNYVGHLIFS